MYELTKQFYFDAAHTLDRAYETESSRRMHGHSFRCEIAVRGSAQANGMVVDFAVLEAAAARERAALDHRFLNEIPGLDVPTLENICAWLWRRLCGEFAGLYCIKIVRDSNSESCSYFGPTA